jgi:hypothetical protein
MLKSVYDNQQNTIQIEPLNNEQDDIIIELDFEQSAFYE